MPEHPIIVLGAGPAGLAAAVACRDQGQRALILDRGPPLEVRDRDDPKTTACGVGGAGLYSDGKFSFFPSATAVWRLEPRRDLSAAHEWVGALLQRHGLPLPASLRDLPEAQVREESSTFSCKTYPSFYVPLLARQSMIAELLRMSEADLLTGREVISLDPRSSGATLSIDCATASSGVAAASSAALYMCRALVVATGRLGGMLFSSIPDAVCFRRLEFGVRIQQPYETFFLREHASLDPKIVLRDVASLLDWRTFCCCRRGEIIEVDTDGIRVLGGRADGAATSFSNVGFSLRIGSESTAVTIWHGMIERLRKARTLSSFPFADSVSEVGRACLAEYFTDAGAHLLLSGLKKFASLLSHDSFSTATIHAPTVEGIGWYPAIQGDLGLHGFPVWIPGDACGMFRGLTAALVSGYFAGLQAAKAI